MQAVLFEFEIIFLIFARQNAFCTIFSIIFWHCCTKSKKEAPRFLFRYKTAFTHSSTPESRKVLLSIQSSRRLFISQNDTDQPTRTVVDDFLQGVGKLHTRFVRHMGKLCVQSLIYQRM